MAMKYIVLDAPSGEAPVVFPRSFIHSWVAGQFSTMRVISAGFVRIGKTGAQCYGMSSTLRIGSRGDVDSRLIMELGAVEDY